MVSPFCCPMSSVLGALDGGPYFSGRTAVAGQSPVSGGGIPESLYNVGRALLAFHLI